MPLHILTVPRSDVDATNKAIARGDEAALNEVRNLFSGYEQPFECFLCPALMEGNDYGVAFLPAPETHNVLAVTMCLSCYNLPSQLRLARSFKLLKKMFKIKAFHFPKQR